MCSRQRRHEADRHFKGQSLAVDSPAQQAIEQVAGGPGSIGFLCQCGKRGRPFALIASRPNPAHVVAESRQHGVIGRRAGHHFTGIFKVAL